MATNGGQSAPLADVAGDRIAKDQPAAQQVKKDKKQTPASEQKKAPQPATNAFAGGGSGGGGDAASADKKLTGAELKKRKQEEKQARRAQAKASAPTTQPAAAPASAGGNKQQKQKHDGQSGGGGGGGGGSGPHPQQVKTVAPAAKEVKPSVPECFSHLSMARRIPLSQTDKDVHPTVLMLGQQMATFAICDSITRVEATLLAFKKVINSYTTPHNTTLTRHFTSHVLNPQIVYLTACRPMCFSMGNAIRWLKLQITKIDIDMSDTEAKKHLSESIDNFIYERVTLADIVIVKYAADMIAENDVILTFAHHHLVERTLLKAKTSGKSFKVIVVDDPFEPVGIAHVKKLAAAGITVTYSPDFGALRTNMQESTAVLVAAEAMFSNGAMYARAGTCDVALTAFDFGVRVISLCETINFTERVCIDSLTHNEIDPERNTDEALRLLFDTTRDKHISAIVTEVGICAAKSVPTIMRKFDEL